LDDATRHVQEQVLAQLREMDGIKGFISLGNRQSGKLLGVALWESEEVMRPTEEAATRIRAGMAEAIDATVVGVEEYEVSVFEVPS
jgi:hypothetical protein